MTVMLSDLTGAFAQSVRFLLVLVLFRKFSTLQPWISNYGG